MKIKSKKSRRYSWLCRYEVVHDGSSYSFRQFEADAVRDARHARREYGGTVEVFRLRSA